MTVFGNKNITLPKSIWPFSLRLVERCSPNNASFDIRPRSLEAWIANLPLAHTGQTAQLLFATLREINNLDLPAMDRFRVMERLCPIFFHIARALSKHYLGASFPLPEKKIKVASLSQEFEETMAIGYKIIISDYFSKKDSNISSIIFITAIHRSLLFLTRALLRTYEIYISPPPSVWKEINWLYRVSEYYELHQQSLSIPESPPPLRPISNTVESIYKQALLLALANPYGLYQTEIRKVHHATMDWQSKCIIFRADIKFFINPDRDIFIVDLESDSIPIVYCPEYYNTKYNNKLEHDRFRFFDINALEPILENFIAAIRNTKISIQTSQTQLSENALHRLILSWSATEQRIFERKKSTDTAKAEIVVGLTAAYDVMVVGLGAVHEIITPPPPITTHPQSKNFSDIDNTWINEIIQENIEAIDVDVGTDSERIIPQDCSIIDQSTGGARIRWCPPGDNTHGHDYKVQVGQLIALRRIKNSDSNPSWVIGMVRWMKCENGVEFGMQLLASRAIPIFIKKERSANTNAQRGLFLPAELIIRQPATLIIPNLFSHPGEILFISDTNNQEQQVQIQQRLENSFDFVRFQFRRIDSQKPPANHPDLSKLTNSSPDLLKSINASPTLKPKDKFFGIWDIL